MTKFSTTLAAALLMAASPGQTAEAQAQAHADEGDLAEKIVGTWELVSYQVEDKATGALIDAMGSAPRGRVIFTQDGWVAFNLEGTDRKPAETDADRAALMKTLVAYIGRYRIEGDQWITQVQTAWAPEWVNTEQRRSIKLHGDEADVMTPWRIMPNWDAGRLSRSIIRFRRAR
ncbi:lipocalin-like domain-containing protein [Methylobacterium sp. E-066]|uniref:lipocalin-like domain-containing protein n=1 Tax=Methylobacterium sp. E-066 TaxID=2836584 RepID=UPI001FB8753E|nr:lipocalin-like domain-containing protein [Methylobacterium sp. E-066]MCJ2143535.1 lipocalin-like domain-containing protein [Methylobacterium sp. E-066]